ncbi:MAG: hypothetical protein ABL921_09675 [Pirellula sp.]
MNRCESVFAIVMLVGLFCMGCRPQSTTTDVNKPASAVIERVAERGPVRLTTRVSPAQPRLSDIVELELLVEGAEGISIQPPAFGQAVGDFLVLDYSERNSDVSGRSLAPNCRLFRYRLEPTHAGKHLIRSLTIEFTDNRSNSESSGEKSKIESEPIEVNIVSDWGDSVPDLANLEPMTPPKEIDYPWSWWWTIPALIVASLAGFAFFFTRRRKRIQPVPPRQSPGEIANMRLALLLSEGLPSKGLFTEFYVRLTGIVRQYIEDTTGIRAPEQTTEEFLRDMHSTKAFSPEQSVRLQSFLEAADMVKYAGQQPNDEQIELSVVRAREFINMRLRSPFVDSSSFSNPLVHSEDSR